MSKYINNDKIQEIIVQVDLKALLEEDVGPLTKESNNEYCGYHKNKHTSESKTSLKVNPDKGVYYCFNCGEGGTAINWLMNNRDMSFIEAVRYLAAKYKIDIDLSEEEMDKINKLHREKEKIIEIFNKTAEIYNKQLKEEHYQLLIKKWGITRETADKLNIGYAPADRKYLLKTLINRGYSRKMLKKTGLFIKGNDFFQGRIIFPYSKNHRTVFFIGRKTKDTPNKNWEQGKYKKLLTHSDKRKYISPAVQNKYLYGTDSLEKTDILIITEGITDAITTIQSGYACISPVTVQFRKKDYKKLADIAKKADKIYIVNDNEESGAGKKGALETARYLHNLGLKVNIVELPKPEDLKKIDLADYWKDHDKDDFEKLLQESKNLLDLGIEEIRQASPDDKSKVAEEVYPLFAGLGAIEKDRNSKKLKEAFGNDVRINIIREKINEVISKQKREEAVENSSEESIDLRSPIEPVKESDNCYYTEEVHHRDGEVYIIRENLSNFKLEIKTIFRYKDGKEILSGNIIYFDNSQEEINLDSKAFVSCRHLKEELPNKAIWTGNNNQLQQIKVNIYANNPTNKKAVELAGRYNDQILLPEITLDKNGILEDPDKVVINLKSNHLLSKMPKEWPDEGKHMKAAEAVYKYLPKINEPAISGAVIAWFFALPWCDLIRTKLGWGGFPHIIIYGEAGSGKTQTAKSIWRLNGISQDNEPFSLPNTRFTRLNNYSSTNLIPVFLDEYRPGAWSSFRSRQIHEELRNIYNKNAAERGRPDLTTESFSLAAPIILCGEDRPRDTTGLEERMIILNPNKDIVDGKDDRYNDFCRKNFNKLQKAPLEAFALPYWKWTLNQDDWTKILNQARKEVIDWKEEEQLAIPERLIDNLSILNFGWFMYLSYAEALDIELDEILIDSDFNEVLKTAYYNVMPEGRHINEFDELVIFIRTMIANSKLYPRIHYTIKNDNILILRLPDILPMANEFAHKTQRNRELLGIDAYRSIIRRLEKDKNSYVISSSAKGSFRKHGDKPCELRGVAIDINKLEEQLDIEKDNWY